MDTQLYLKKLNLKEKAPTLEYLNEIIFAHQRIISFNNLAVFYHPGEILNLEIEPLFKKVIIEGSGGYCFENNKVFYFLLKNLGFEVEPKAARVLYDNPGDVPRTHRTTIVTIEGKKYLADVGFGKDVPRKAVPLGGVRTTPGNQVIVDGDLYRHQLVKKDGIVNLYTFDDGHYQESDFMLANYYTNTHPNSKFVKELMVVRIDGELVEFISGTLYSRIDKGERIDKKISNQTEFQAYLAKFNINKNYDFRKLLKS